MANLTMNVLFDGVEKIKEFVNRLSVQPFEADLSSGRYIVDGKSIMGIFSLDLSKPVELTIHAEPEECEEFVDWLGLMNIIDLKD